MSITKQPFNTHRITYGISSHDTTTFRDIARIDCHNGPNKVGQILFGSSISPGNNGSMVNGQEIHLYFPLSHFPNIMSILNQSHSQPLALFLQTDGPNNTPRTGGITTEP